MHVSVSLFSHRPLLGRAPVHVATLAQGGRFTLEQGRSRGQTRTDGWRARSLAVPVKKQATNLVGLRLDHLDVGPNRGYPCSLFPVYFVISIRSF